MSDVMYNSKGKRVGIVDNEFEKVDISKFNDLNIDSKDVYKDMFEDITATLSYEDNKEFIDDVYEKYLSDKVDWLNAADMETRITVLLDDDVVQISVSAEQFINSFNINTAYVESHDLKGEKGDIIKSKMLDAFEKADKKIEPIKKKKDEIER